MRCLLLSLTLSVVAAHEVPLQAVLPSAQALQQQGALTGRWRVKFNMSGNEEKNLLFDVRGKGIGSFLLLDTPLDGKSAGEPQPAVWSRMTNDSVSFSGEIELPIGTCCREVGTLILKGKFNSSKTISGKAIFVTSTVEEENCIGFRSMLGTFTATRVPAED